MPITPKQIASAQSVQHSAAHDRSNQIRVVAGPGTGKSFAIQERVRWLLERGKDPSRIFVVSFTRASARDLQRRIHKYCASHGISIGVNVSVTTLHSLALRMLRAAGLLAYPSDPIVMDQWELKNVFDIEFSRASGIRPKRCGEVRREHEAFWSTGQWGPPSYIPPNPPISKSERDSLIQFHNPRTQIYSCVLPGEIVRQCVENISSGTLDPVSLLNIEHLILDEYQDLNPCDLELTDCMITSGAITFVAGDDDQSIYSFRFASPTGIQIFIHKYPSATDHNLIECFRCTPNVLQTARTLIGANPLPNRILKGLASLYSSAKPPLAGQVYRWIFRSARREARSIAESSRDLIQNGISPREILILLSNRDLLERDLATALDTAKVPYERPYSNDFINSIEGRLAMTLLRIVCSQDDYVAHRILLEIPQGVGIGTCINIANTVVQNNLNYRDLFYRPLPTGSFKGRELTALNTARNICSQLSTWEPTDIVNQRGTEIETLLDSLLGNSARQTWVNVTAPLPADTTLQETRDYLWADTDEQQGKILGDVYDRLGQPIPEGGVLPQKVRIMTMHGAKGLSAKIVFIPGLEEQVLPGQWRRPYPGLVLEAARLLYVSVSRARVACILSYSNTRIVYGRFSTHGASRFTRDLGAPFANRTQGLSHQKIQNIVRECSQL